MSRLVAAALLLAAALPVAGSTPALDGLRGKARAALDRGDGIAAEVPLREAVRNGTPADAVRDLVGEALLLEGDRTEARRWLTEGAFAPDTAGNGWRVRGRLELAEGNLQRAAQAFDQALRFTPDDVGLWVDIARLRFSGGEQAQAIGAADHAVRLDPNNVRALELRGMLVREQYGLRAALPWFEAGLRIAPNDKALLGEYAATLGDLGQYRAMLAVCRKLIEVDPKNARALYLQAVLAARAGKTELARSILLRTGSALRDMPAAIQLNGILEYRAGNVNLAVEYFDRLSRMQPDNLEAQKMLARALDRQGDYRQILDRFEIVARQPWASPYMLALVTAGKAATCRALSCPGGAARRSSVRATAVGRTAGRAGRALQRSAEFRDQRAALCPGAARNAAQRRGAGGRHAPARRQSRCVGSTPAGWRCQDAGGRHDRSHCRL